MVLEPTKQQIAAWLGKIGRDRHWLAEQCGASKPTVDGWFSKKGFPRPALRIISALMAGEVAMDDDLSSVTFSLEEFGQIDAARKLAGYTSRKEFYRDAIIEKAAAIRRAAEERTDVP